MYVFEQYINTGRGQAYLATQLRQRHLRVSQEMKSTILIFAPAVLVLLVIAPGIVHAQSTTASGSTPWQEFGEFFGPIQKYTGVSNNDQT